MCFRPSYLGEVSNPQSILSSSFDPFLLKNFRHCFKVVWIWIAQAETFTEKTITSIIKKKSIYFFAMRFNSAFEIDSDMQHYTQKNPHQTVNSSKQVIIEADIYIKLKNLIKIIFIPLRSTVQRFEGYICRRHTVFTAAVGHHGKHQIVVESHLQ